ncbi:hypothetical protein KEM54_000497 [Ascosphaera aggregata]|nr:hypothetical protein KEM54_000497 [Ascosphaera aggregata]
MKAGRHTVDPVFEILEPLEPTNAPTPFSSRYASSPELGRRLKTSNWARSQNTLHPYTNRYASAIQAAMMDHRYSEETYVPETTTTQTSSRVKTEPARRASGTCEQQKGRMTATTRTATGSASLNVIDESGSPAEASPRPFFRKNIGSASAMFANWIKGRKNAMSPSSSRPASRIRTRTRHSNPRSTASGSTPWLPKDASDEVIESLITSIGPEAYDRAFRNLDFDEFETMLAKHARLAGRIYKEV